MTPIELGATIALMARKRQITAPHVVKHTGVHIRKAQRTLKHLCEVGVLEKTKVHHQNIFYRVKT